MLRVPPSLGTAISLCLLPLLSHAQDTVGGLFKFDQDVRVFTAQAGQNTAGYDHEWRKEGMHVLRTEVRADLFRTRDSSYRARLSAFRQSCNGDWSSWESYALLTNGPPDFALAYDPASTPFGDNTRDDMAGLSPLLAEFYAKARVPELWQKYRPRLQELNDRFRPHGRRALDDITDYCGLDKDYFSQKASRIHVICAPLESYFTAFTDKVNIEIYLVFGPQSSEPSPSASYHEALHHVLSPLTGILETNATHRFRDLFTLATSDGHIGYGHIDEAFVRAIACVLDGRLFHEPDTTVVARVTNEYKLGFILRLSIYEQLAEYEDGDRTFMRCFPEIFAGIDVEQEKQRWRELITNAR